MIKGQILGKVKSRIRKHIEIKHVLLVYNLGKWL